MEKFSSLDQAVLCLLTLCSACCDVEQGSSCSGWERERWGLQPRAAAARCCICGQSCLVHATAYTPLVIAIPATFWSVGTDSVDEELAHARTGLNGGENGSLSEWTEGRGK